MILHWQNDNFIFFQKWIPIKFFRLLFFIIYSYLQWYCHMNNYVDFQHLGFLFSQKKECKYLKDYLVTKWTLGVKCVSASYHPKINLGPNTRTRVVPSKFNTREDYKSNDCKKIKYVIITCRLTRWETKEWYQKIEKKNQTNKQKPAPCRLSNSLQHILEYLHVCSSHNVRIAITLSFWVHWYFYFFAIENE